MSAEDLSDAHIFSSESGPSKEKDNNYCQLSDREPLCIIVEPSLSSLSDASSSELLIDTRKKRIYPKFRKKKNYIRIVLPENFDDIPTTSKIHRNVVLPAESPFSSESKDEQQVIDINLQSDNEIDVDDDSDDKSVVMAYLRDRENMHVEGGLLTNKKKATLMSSVPKMETIPESEHDSPLLSAEGSKAETEGKEDIVPDKWQ